MIKIGDYTKKFVLDLNNNTKNEYKFNITSSKLDGTPIPWGVEIVTDELVEIEKSGNSLIVKFDYENITKESFILLKNYKQEFFKIKIIPNKGMVCKKYVFKFDNIKVSNGELSFDIISKRNDKDHPWECIYRGQPLSYYVTKMSGIGTETISVKSLVELNNEMITYFKYRQKDSDNEIKLVILNDKNGIKKAD